MAQENRYGYVLKKNTEKKEQTHYHKSDLLLMTAYQLKEICRTEKIIQGVVNPMDKEELIRVILRYRGADEYFLIRTANETGWRPWAAYWKNAPWWKSMTFIWNAVLR